MTGMVSLEVTMFFLILVGFAVKRFRLVGEAGKGVLTDLVVNLILPCNIIKSFMIEFDMQVLKGFFEHSVDFHGSSGRMHSAGKTPVWQRSFRKE